MINKIDKLPTLKTTRVLLVIATSIFTGIATGQAEVQLPAVFADHMVVQRRHPVNVWGNAKPKEFITVSFRGESEKTTADEFGRWSVYLKQGEAGGPFTLEVTGENKINLEDILVGDVWIASGQSNMEFTPAWGMDNGKAEVAAANYPKIRLMALAGRASEYPLNNMQVRLPWSLCTPESVQDFSAIGYFFARDLQKKENIPIGIIDSSWGGTSAAAWTSLNAIASDATLMPFFGFRARIMDEYPARLLQEMKEHREDEEAKAAGKPLVERPWRPELASGRPGSIYNAMIAPLTPLSITGVLWYQGESDTDPTIAPLYGRLLKTLIVDWRKQWGQGDFPFLLVQIANWGSIDEWATVREGQREALELRNTAMTVTIDVGDPIKIHPTNKQEVGRRLTLSARALAYGEKVEYSGPLFRQVRPQNNTLRIWFDQAESGLIAKNGELRGFTVAGRDGKYLPATAKIEDGTVVVFNPALDHPLHVRYGWESNPDCNLYNGSNLPASPFEGSTVSVQ